MSSSEVQGALGVLAAALPGVLVALLSHYLSTRRSAAATRVRLANARALLTVEFDANRQALQTFWQTINALDTAPQGKTTAQHLAALAEQGLLGYTLPPWSSIRWDAFSAENFGALLPKELFALDRAYRDLRDFGEAYAKLLVIPAQEQEVLSGDRFWPSRFAEPRAGEFDRLTQTVARLLSVPALQPFP